jgi:hypothetical protein
VVLGPTQGDALDRLLSLEIADRLKAVDERVIEVLFRFSDEEAAERDPRTGRLVS